MGPQENVTLKEELQASKETVNELLKKAEEYKTKSQTDAQQLQELSSRLQYAEQEHERQRHDFQLARQTSQRQIKDLEDQLETSLVQHFSAPGPARGRGNSFGGDSLASQLGCLEEADEEEDEQNAGGGGAGFDPHEMARVARENVRLQSQLASSEEAVEALKLQARRAAQLRAGAKWQLAAARAASKRMEESGVREDNKKLRGMLESERLSSEEVGRPPLGPRWVAAAGRVGSNGRAPAPRGAPCAPRARTDGSGSWRPCPPRSRTARGRGASRRAWRCTGAFAAATTRRRSSAASALSLFWSSSFPSPSWSRTSTAS
ncbi:unnamed protein product [Prorocentrum cordatum]|uniref:Uncharacterized protein n=1 Tax=Prorocentrum cordatum TaxID=2364126 RepID=A0ABN9SNY5_9DINO|nr:unnamed protein product [Polarella glacialis]